MYIMRMMRVSVAGASGYAGGELLRFLAGHPMIEIGPISAGSKAGQRLGEVHPQLLSLAGRVLEPTTPDVLGAADLVFLALPHGESAAIASELPADARIVDLGADHRLVDPRQWAAYYGGLPHAGSWTYGLPELAGSRERIASSHRVANPGCYATAVTLALAPLAAASLIGTTDLVVVAASGTSGAGRRPSESLLASEVMGSMSAYKVGGIHQHIPEIEQSIALVSGQQARLSFTTLLAPMPRGIISTSTAPVRPGTTRKDIVDCLAEAYAGERFVRLLEPGSWPRTSSVSGTNSALLQVELDEHSGRAIIVSAIDNLGKGAAGQAIQNANIMLGLDESLGLPTDGGAP